ncbi:hypothetical protein WDW86_11710 [Bdellovibrionota bacterium FG-2]
MKHRIGKDSTIEEIAADFHWNDRQCLNQAELKFLKLLQLKEAIHKNND